MESVTLLLFCAALFLCLFFDQSIVIALAAGLVIFWIYGLKKGFSLRQMFDYSINGVKTVKNILVTFLLIGMLTALWREAGTIPVIVCFAAKLIHPSIFLLMTFLLNCLISFLTGTAFGTAATMGVICSTMGASLGVSPFLMGGAVLSGAYFGDRCSPVSTSALLTAELTGTDIFENIRNMLRSAAVPFVLSCVIYGGVGIFFHGSGAVPDLAAVFGKEFRLSVWAVLPAVVLLLLSLGKVNVKIAMTASIVTALGVCLLVQQTDIRTVPLLLVTGFSAEHADVAAMLNGGGIFSMVRVTAIVCISSAYAGIFQKTGLLESLKSFMQKFAGRITNFAAILLAAVLTGIVACNQTLTIMLTDQLTKDLEKDRKSFALALEDSAVVVAPLIPWSIACGVTLSAVAAPHSAVLFACFLYLLPAWRLVRSLKKR